MDSEEPTQTVKFSEPVRGQNIMDAVRKVCENGSVAGANFYTEQVENGQTRIGQSARNPNALVRVRPTTGQDSFAPDETYSEVIVDRSDAVEGQYGGLANVHFDIAAEEVYRFAGVLAKTVETGIDVERAHRTGLGPGPAKFSDASQRTDGARDQSGGYRQGGPSSGNVLGG